MTGKTSENDQEKNHVYKGSILEEFKELEEVQSLLNNLKNVVGNQIQEELSMQRFSFVINEYQEQPHLLDPHLESLLGDMLATIRDPDSSKELVDEVFKYMFHITKTRGYKVIVRMMPHEVADLEPVLTLLKNQEDSAVWETRYMLLLWLSMVCMIPFDMERLDSNVKSESGEVRKPIMDRILHAGNRFLHVFDKSCDAAAYMLSRFLTRPDVKTKRLPSVLEESLLVIKNAESHTMEGMRKLSGTISMLSLLCKFGKREDVLPYAPEILETLMNRKLKDSTNTLLRKQNIKFIQRLGLLFLKARIAAWRYTRGNRSLADNLVAPSGSSAVNQSNDSAEDVEVPEEIEEVIEQLLSSLRDDKTIVRWSSAKGIGRVTGRLPREFADEVVGTVLELFTFAESDSAWHGGCLALAELGRRGLLLPHRLPDVVPVVIKALAYDEKRGTFSVGSHVRDAACYVCWSFARAYDPVEIVPYVNQIASSLLIVSLFDREVSVRRAASAAFQENVGRQGTFPHGIDIVTTCDYYAVGHVKNCYLELSVFIAQYPEYLHPVIDHLVEVKAGHWSSTIRELAAKALHNLTSKAPDYMTEIVLVGLLKHVTGSDLFWRHGSIVAVAEIVHGIAEYGATINKSIGEILGKEMIKDLMCVSSVLDQAKLYRGFGGELMRKAVCCMIDKFSQSHIPCDETMIHVWQNLIDDCLHHTELDVRESAASAIPAFMTAYYRTTDGKAKPAVQESIIEKYLKQMLNCSKEMTRMGHCLAIGYLPDFMLHGKLRPVLSALIKASSISEKDAQWAESRRDAVLAIGRVCKTVGLSATGDANSVMCSTNIDDVYEALLVAMTDYTIVESRGDVGAWLREAAMLSLKVVTSLVVSECPRLLTADICRSIFCAVLQQSVEKIDRTRGIACEIFYSLLHLHPKIPNIPHDEELLDIFRETKVEKINWAVPADTFPLFTPLLALPAYLYHVLLGITVSVGGLTESTVKASASSLQTYLRTISDDAPRLNTFSHTLLKIFQDYARVTRVTLPLLKMIDQLICNGSFDLFIQDESHSFGTDLFMICKAETDKCGDPLKLLAASELFCDMLMFPKCTRNRCLGKLMVYLCHRYPRVRKVTADKLYESLLSFEDIVSDENLESVMSILCDTKWDDKDLTDIRVTRNHLCDLMNVPKPTLQLTNVPKPTLQQTNVPKPTLQQTNVPKPTLQLTNVPKPTLQLTK